MAHYAKIKSDNTVETVLVIPDEQDYRGAEYIKELGIEGRWLKTSYNTYGNVHIKGGIPFRKNYAEIGGTYDEKRDAFIPKKKYPSWILNEESCVYEAPVKNTAKSDVQCLWLEDEQRWNCDPIPKLAALESK
jgi:hypothetical protein